MTLIKLLFLLCCIEAAEAQWNRCLSPLDLRYSASCEVDKYTVAVQDPKPDPDGTMSPFLLQPYNKPNCLNLSRGANSTHNWLTVPYVGDCGVTIDTIDSTYVKYRHQVLMRSQSTDPSISRYYQFRWLITCRVNRFTNQTQWLDTSPPESFSQPDANWSLDLAIKLFEDANFTREIGTSVGVPAGTRLFVQLSVDNRKLQAGGRAKILMENCVAFPFKGEGRSLKHVVINNQLADDNATDIHMSPALHEVHFKMEAFQIANYTQVNMSCDVYVCPESDNSVRCKGPAANAQHEPNGNRFAYPVVDPAVQSMLPIGCGANRFTNLTLWLYTSTSQNKPDIEGPDHNEIISIDLVIKMFKDAEFTQEFTKPVRLPVGTVVYVQLSVDKQKLQASGRAKILVENCVTFPFKFAPEYLKHTLIKSQLSDDLATDILKSPVLHEVRFKMETFKFLDNKELYMRCNSYVCPANDTSMRCTGPAANAQHEPSATEFNASEADANAKSKGKALNVVSPGIDVPQIRFKPFPVFTEDDLPGVGPADEVRIGRHDNKCYHKLSNGVIRLYHKPKQNSSAVVTEYSTKYSPGLEELLAENPCLNQF